MTAAEQSQIGKLMPAALRAWADVVDLNVMTALAAPARAMVCVSALPAVAHPDQAPNRCGHWPGTHFMCMKWRWHLRSRPRARGLRALRAGNSKPLALAPTLDGELKCCADRLAASSLRI